MSEADGDTVILLRNPVLARALSDLIREAGARPGAAGGTTEPLDTLWSREWEGADLVILDPADLGGTPGSLQSATEALKALPRLFAYASEPSVAQARACMQAAFRGYVPMSAEPAQVARALAVIGNGGIYLDRRFSGALTSAAAAPPQGEARSGRLSEREMAVLKRVAMGMSQKQIAADLDISHKTVDTYRARGMRKLELANRAHLVRFAIDHAWLD